ncbi:MAG: GNAT family N-acetyltransferase [Bacteroidetes bacterium]|nr:GNAT family N-acetyltransferase [Bacteroidota bacterium]
MNGFEIQPTTAADLEFIYWLFEEAMAYQKRKNFPVWNGYSKDVLQQDIDLRRQYKIVINNEIACIFSVLESDEIIWREKNRDKAIYLHRIVVNPNYKGQSHFRKILDWSVEYAIKNNLHYIRMDTWGENPNIIAYYQSFGFKLVEFFTTGCSTELPVQNRNLKLALLEYDMQG